jgi:hypothetical protein
MWCTRIPSDPANPDIMFWLTFQAPSACPLPILLPCPTPLSNVAERRMLIGSSVVLLRCACMCMCMCVWVCVRVRIRARSSICTCVRRCCYCCCRCRGGREARREKGPAWLFDHFQMIDFGSPWSTAKLGEVVAARTTRGNDRPIPIRFA